MSWGKSRAVFLFINSPQSHRLINKSSQPALLTLTSVVSHVESNLVNSADYRKRICLESKVSNKKRTARKKKGLSRQKKRSPHSRRPKSETHNLLVIINSVSTYVSVLKR